MLKNDKLDALILLSGSVLLSKNVELYQNGLALACQTPTVARYQSAKKHQPGKTQPGIRHVFPIRTAHRRGCFNCRSLSFAAVMSVEAVRTTLWDTIVRFFDEYLSVSYVTETQPPKQLEDIKEPSFSDKGWEKQVVLETASMRCVIYRKNGTKILTLHRRNP